MYIVWSILILLIMQITIHIKISKLIYYNSLAYHIRKELNAIKIINVLCIIILNIFNLIVMFS